MRFSILIGAVALASACFGQSGSEVIKPPPMNLPDPNPNPNPSEPIPPGIPMDPHCPCDAASGYHQQVRAVVLDVETIEPFTHVWRYTLRAEAILSELRGNPEELTAGDRFGGYWSGQLACEGTAEPFEVGAEVLAFYRRGLQDGALCCEYLACSDDCPSESEEGDDDAAPEPSDAPRMSPRYQCEQACVSRTATACAEHAEEATLRGELLLLPWGETFVVGRNEHGEATITTADLPALTLYREACMDALEDRFDTLHPAPPSTAPEEQAGDDAPSDGPPAPMPAPSPAEPPPRSPSLPMMTPAPSAATPDAGTSGDMPPPPTHPVGVPSGPPPAHPEEVRVRCQ